MDFNDILDDKSPQMSELLVALEKISTNVDKGLEQRKLALSGDIFLDNHEVCAMLHLSQRTLQDYPAPVLALQ